MAAQRMGGCVEKWVAKQRDGWLRRGIEVDNLVGLVAKGARLLLQHLRKSSGLHTLPRQKYTKKDQEQCYIMRCIIYFWSGKLFN